MNSASLPGAPSAVDEEPLNPKANRDRMTQTLVGPSTRQPCTGAIQAAQSVGASERTAGIVMYSSDGGPLTITIYEGMRCRMQYSP